MCTSVYVWVCTLIFRYPQRRVGHWIPRTGVTNGCELSSVGAGIWTSVFCKRSVHSNCWHATPTTPAQKLFIALCSVGRDDGWGTCGSQKTTCKSSSLYHVGSGNWTPVVRLCGKHLPAELAILPVLNFWPPPSTSEVLVLQVCIGVCGAGHWTQGFIHASQGLY